VQALRTEHEVAAGVYMEHKGYPRIEPAHAEQQAPGRWLLCYDVEGGELELTVIRSARGWDFEYWFFPDER
jgi:hypothetical protein